MREVTINKWCDYHALNDEKVEATFEQKVPVNGTTYVLDLCRDHNSQFEQWFQRVMEIGTVEEGKSKPKRRTGKVDRRYSGRRPSIDTSKPEAFKCREPGCGYDSQGDRGKLSNHCRKVHSTVLGDYDWSDVQLPMQAA